MNTYTIIHTDHSLSLAQENILGNPVTDEQGRAILTPCDNIAELLKELSKALGVELYYCHSVSEWTQHIEKMKQEFTNI